MKGKHVETHAQERWQPKHTPGLTVEAPRLGGSCRKGGISFGDQSRGENTDTEKAEHKRGEDEATAEDKVGDRMPGT